MLNARSNNVRVETKRQKCPTWSSIKRHLPCGFIALLSIYNDLVQTDHICVWFLFALLIVLPLFFPIDAENQNQNSHLNFHPESDLES